MKKLHLTSWSIFIIGILFKLFHFPGTGLLLSLGTLLLLIHSIIYLIKNWTKDLPTSILLLSFSFWTISLLTRIQYWSIGPIILGFPILFIVSIILSITYFILLINYKIKIGIKQILLIGYILFSFELAYIHSDQIHYFFRLNTILNNDSRNYDYAAWDKYSWFLYIRNKQEEAIQANEKAQQAINLCLKQNKNDQRAIQYIIKIEQHKKQIKNKNWTSY